MAGCNRTNHTTPALCTPDAGQRRSHEAGQQQRLSRADSALRSTSASSAIERRCWQVIALLADGLPLAEIVAAAGCRPGTIRQVAQRYRECGEARLADRWQRSAQLNTALASLFTLDWTDPSASCCICARCGQIHWFVPQQEGASAAQGAQ